MARITPGSGTFVSLDDGEPYEFTLQSFEVERDKVFPGSDQGPTDQVKFVWQVGGNPDDTIFTWAAIKIGKNRTTGKVAKFRQVLNALAGRSEVDDIAFVDDVSLEWGYADGTEHRLAVGQSVIVRGQNEDTPNGVRYSVIMWRPAVAPAPRRAPVASVATAPAVNVATGTPPARRPVAVVVAPDDVPF